MAIGDVNPSNFEAYEGIRILIPGATAVSVYGAVVTTLAPSAVSPASNAFAAVVVALLVGLALLFLDLPVKSAQYLTTNLPHYELERWDVDPKPYGSYLNLYFAMLDVSFPATLRNRSLYMGSIFRIGLEGIYFLGLSAIGVLAAVAAYPDTGPSRGGTTSTRIVLFCMAVALGAVFVGAVLGRVRYRQRGSTGVAKALSLVWDELAAEVGWTGLAAIVASGPAFAWFVHTDSPYACLTAVGISTFAWAVLYFRGRPTDDGEPPRRRLAPPTAVLLYAIPTALASVGAGLRVGEQSPLDTGAALAWGGLCLVPALLIAGRGHERKLNGSFAAQTTWMRMQKDELMKTYKLAQR